MPSLARIMLHPIKSLDPVIVREATILESGALEHDRTYAIFDAEGRFVNGKRHASVHRLRAHYELDVGFVTLSAAPEHSHALEQTRFHLNCERALLENWLSGYFGFRVFVRQDSQRGFPDDTDASGPTILSTATLETIASWFPGLDVENIRLRLRANLEAGDTAPFWEDRLFAAQGESVSFRIGDVKIEGINPCQRCVVFTRDPRSAEAFPEFQKTFSELRKTTLPAWANHSRFNHFYRLALNTRIPATEAGKTLKVGDEFTEL